MRRKNRTRDMVFRCRDFARDTGTQVLLRLAQSSPDTPALRRCVLTFTPTGVYRQQPPGQPEVWIPIQEASSMADHWTQEVF